MRVSKLSELTIEQKIGHLICARGCVSPEDKEFIMNLVKNRALGGVQGLPSYRLELAQEILEIADYPILVCADMEGGVGEARSLTPMGIASTGDKKLAYDLARATAVEAKRMGINLIWGPVVDFTNKDALCSVPRSFGDNADVISEYAIEMIKGYTDEGMVCTAKHFVSDKTCWVDGHMTKWVSQRTKEDLINEEMVPYLRAMKEANLPGIMTTHVLHEKIDDKYIASLSKNAISMIREKGFDGLIVTDSLAMMSIVQDYGIVECLGIAIAAGNDMVLPNYRLSVKESYDYLMEAYKKGVFSEERLNDAVRHVLEAQEKTLKKPSMPELNEELRDAVRSSKAKSIVGIYKDGLTPAISKDSKKFFVLVCEVSDPNVMGYNQEIEVSASFSRQSREKLRDKILEEFPGSECIILSEYPKTFEGEKVCAGASEADEVIFFTFATCGCYLGTDCLSRRVEALIDVNMENVAAIAHIGNPYVLGRFPNAKRRFNCLAPYGSEELILKALKGEFEPTGKLSINIE